MSIVLQVLPLMIALALLAAHLKLAARVLRASQLRWAHAFQFVALLFVLSIVGRAISLNFGGLPLPLAIPVGISLHLAVGGWFFRKRALTSNGQIVGWTGGIKLTALGLGLFFATLLILALVVGGLFKFLSFNTAGPRSDISAQIEAQLHADPTGSVDLRRIGPEEWERMCVLTPYTNNEAASNTLGFPWDAEKYTAIEDHDGINVLVFIQDNQVLAYTEHPRNQGDFSRLEPSCVTRDQAMVTREKGSSGWIYLVTPNG